MKDKRTILIAFLLASYYACAGADIMPPVTVIYSHTPDDGTPITKVIPWEDGLDMGKAIATAGGYSSPPYRGISLIRDGDTTPVSPKSILKGESKYVSIKCKDSAVYQAVKQKLIDQQKIFELYHFALADLGKSSSDARLYYLCDDDVNAITFCFV